MRGNSQYSLPFFFCINRKIIVDIIYWQWYYIAKGKQND